MADVKKDDERLVIRVDSATDIVIINVALKFYAETVKRQLAKEISGSELYSLRAAHLRRIQDLMAKVV